MIRIPFILLSTSDGSPLTGATPTVTISKDGGAFTVATNSPAEIGNGYYYVDLTTAETTVTNNVIVRATATGAQPTAVVWEPEPTIPTAADNATAVWSAQTKEVTINSTQAETFATASSVANIATVAGAIKAKTDNLPANPAAQGAQMSLTNEAITSVKDGLATANNVTTAKAEIIAAMPDVSRLSTFDPSTDTVTIDATQAAGMATATGFATPANITDAVTALETYGQEHWQTADVSELATNAELANTQENIISAMPTTDITAIKAGLYNWELIKDGSTESITAKSGSSTVAQSTITRNSSGEIVKMEETE